jgi:SAM-dependent methyltransferase
MNGVQRHYDTLLGQAYEWSVSRSGDAFTSAAAWLARHRLDTAHRYLDLGAGFGAHSVSLARLGKDVTAVEANGSLAGRLRDVARSEGLNISVHEDDLLASVQAATAASWDVVLCLRDTLCLLDSFAEIERLFEAAARVLNPGGIMVVSYRDATAFAASGVGRFIEVARDETRIMQCMLEALDPQHLRVTDILTEVGPSGPTTRISDYVKLRVAPVQLNDAASRAGLRLVQEVQEDGFVVQSWKRPVDGL